MPEDAAEDVVVGQGLLSGGDGALVEVCVHVQPALSSVAHPTAKIAGCALELLLNAIEGKVQAPQTVTVQPQFIDRESTGPVRCGRVSIWSMLL